MERIKVWSVTLKKRIKVWSEENKNNKNTIKYDVEGSYLVLTWVPSRPAKGESFTPNVMDIVGGSNSIVGRAVNT